MRQASGHSPRQICVGVVSWVGCLSLETLSACAPALPSNMVGQFVILCQCALLVWHEFSV